jgi:hypothetical protein
VAKTKQTTERVKAVLRQYPNGEVIALFPELKATVDGALCMCYAHQGQHGAADYRHVIATTAPARDEKAVKALLRELEGAPYHYVLDLRARYTRKG